MQPARIGLWILHRLYHCTVTRAEMTKEAGQGVLERKSFPVTAQATISKRPSAQLSGPSHVTALPLLPPRRGIGAKVQDTATTGT